MRMKSGWMMVVTMLMLCTAPAAAEVMDGIAAVVNDEVITLSEYNTALSTVVKRVQRNYPGASRDEILQQIRQPILENMINDILLKQEAKRLGIVVKDEEVNASVKSVLEKRNLTMESLEELLAKDNMTFDQYKEGVRMDILKSRVIGREIRAKVAVSNDEIGNYYRDHRSEYEGKEAVRLKQIVILVPEDADATFREQHKAEAEEVLKKLKEGRSFEEMAHQYARGPARGMNGDIGFVEKGTLLPPVDAAAFQLMVGQISGVVESPIGYHILQAVEKRGGGTKTMAAVRDEIEERIAREKAEKRFGEWMTELRKKSFIEIRMKP